MSGGGPSGPQFRQSEDVIVGENCRLNLQASSCFILGPDNRFRRFIFAVVDHRYFERAVLAIIVLNCITLILATPWIEDQPGVYIIVDVGEYLFQILFTIEMVLKIIALGFVLHPHSYLRSNWNRIDFVIVILGFVSFFFSSNLSAVRMVRILRPLKTVSKVPALTNIVVTLAASVPRLRDVLLLLSFVIMIFAVLALQLFVGVMQQRCYFYPNVSVNGSYRADAALYPYDPNPCSLNPDSGNLCPLGTHCEVHRDIYFESLKNFDNIGNAVISVFKIVTMDNWPQDLARIQNGNGVTYFMFVFPIILFGSLFAINLILAILSSEFDNASQGVKNSVDDDSDRDENASPTLSRHASDAQKPVQTAASEEPLAVVVPKSEESDRSCCRQQLVKIVNNDWFVRFMLFVTFVNVVALALDHHGIEPTFLAVLNWINFVCTIVFGCEMLLKVSALWLEYFKDGFNDFDFVLVLISIPEMVLSGNPSSGGSSFSALRALRVVRVLKATKHELLRHLLETVVKALASTAYLFLLMLVFLLIFALIGVTFLEHAYPEGSRPNYRNIAEAMAASFIVVTGENWVDVMKAGMDGSHWTIVFYFLILFCIGNYIILNLFVAILIGSFAHADDDDAPGDLLEDTVAAAKPIAPPQSDHTAADEGGQLQPAGEPPNSSDDAVAQCASLNIAERPFLTSAVNPFAPVSQQVAGASGPAVSGGGGIVEILRHEGNETGSLIQCSSLCRSASLLRYHRFDQNHTVAEILMNLFGTKRRKAAASPAAPSLSPALSVSNNGGDSPTHDLNLTGKSFYIFGPDNKLRIACATIVLHPYFELFVLLLIVFSCVMLGFDNPTSRENANVRRMLTATDIILTTLFALEAVMQCIAWGVVLEEDAYLKSPWNCLDLFVVVTSIIGFVVPTLQMFRALRTFRLAARAESLRVVISATFNSLPAIGNVVILLAFGYVVFGILGVQLFKGAFVSCTDPSITHIKDCVGNFTVNTTEWSRSANGTWSSALRQTVVQRAWQHAFFNFNHLGEALKSLFALGMNDGWSVILYQTTDATDYEHAMERNARAYMGFYVIIFLVFGCYFMMNLFIGSLIDNFSKERDKREGKD